MTEENQAEKTKKPVIDFSKQREETSKKEYYLDKIECWWHNQSSKAKFYIIGGLIFTVGAGIGLGPCGGWNHFTKALRGEISVLKTEKQKFKTKYEKTSLEKTSIASKLDLEKKDREHLEVMLKKYQSNYAIMAKVNQNYDPTIRFKVQYKADNLEDLMFRTASIKTNGAITDKSNMTHCGARYMVIDKSKEIVGDKLDKYIKDIEENKLNLAFDRKAYGDLIGIWAMVEGKPNTIDEISITKQQAKEFFKYFNEK